MPALRAAGGEKVHSLAKAGSGVAGVLSIALAFGTALPRAAIGRLGSGQPGSLSRQPADDRQAHPDVPSPERVADFLSWAHPSSEECTAASGIKAKAIAEHRIRVDFEIDCRSGRQVLAAILDTREGNGVWQIVEGFEADAAWLDRKLKSGSIRIAPGRPGPAPEGTPIAELL